MEINVIGKNR